MKSKLVKVVSRCVELSNDTEMCSNELIKFWERALNKHAIPPVRLKSGAGHDVLSFAGIAPISMLFVRCKDGVSHSPEEDIASEDAELAVNVLMDMILLMAEEHVA